MLKTVIVFDSVGLDIPDYVMTNDDGGRRPAAASRHTADMVSLIKRCFIYHISAIMMHALI